MDLSGADVERLFVEAFGDATVKLPANFAPPERFKKTYDDWDSFNAAWRAFQAEIGFDPDDPSTW